MYKDLLTWKVVSNTVPEITIIAKNGISNESDYNYNYSDELKRNPIVMEPHTKKK